MQRHPTPATGHRTVPHADPLAAPGPGAIGYAVLAPLLDALFALLFPQIARLFDRLEALLAQWKAGTLPPPPPARPAPAPAPLPERPVIPATPAGPLHRAPPAPRHVGPRLTPVVPEPASPRPVAPARAQLSRPTGRPRAIPAPPVARLTPTGFRPPVPPRQILPVWPVQRHCANNVP